jgi:hypothetical protein
MEIYNYVSREIPTNSVVAFNKPRILRLFSGVNSIFTDLDHFESSVGTHLLMRTEDMNPQIPAQFQVNHRFENYVILEK